MDGVFKDETGPHPGHPGALDAPSGNPAPGGCSPADSDPFDNNNQIAYVDQSDSVDSSPVKEAGPPARKPDSATQRSPGTTRAPEPERGLRKGRPALASQDSSLSSTSPSSPVPVKASQKPSRPRSKGDAASRKEAGGRHAAPGHPRKEPSARAPDSASSPAPQKAKSASSLAHAPPSAAAAKKASGPAPRGPFPPGKGRTSERTLSREGSRQSLASDRGSLAPGSKPGSPRVGQARAGESRGDGRHVRSSSAASLRSPGAGARAGLKRDSKSEDKGLSFLKSALRQKETRRSADLGKTALLSRKAGKGAAADDKAERGPPPPAPQPPPAPKDPAPSRHSLLSTRRSKSSQLEAGAPSAPGARPAGAAEKPAPKVSAKSMPTSARPSQKPQ